MMATNSSSNCSPCNRDDVVRDAVKWFLVCEEGTCQECEKAHKKTKALRDHTSISFTDYIERKDVQATDLLPSIDSATWSEKLRQIEETIPMTLENLKKCIENRRYVVMEEIGDVIQRLRDKFNSYFDEIESDCQSEEKEGEKSLLPAIRFKEFDATYISVYLGNCGSISPLTGCTISPDGQIFVADLLGSGKVSVYDKEGKFLRFMPGSDPPFDVTAIDERRIGVTYDSKFYFEIIDTITNTVEKRVDSKGARVCFGISCYNDRIYVLAGEEGVIVTDLSGNIINTIVVKENQFFMHIAATSDRIYMTDTYKNELHCIDTEGNLIWMSDIVDHPKGITVDKNGNIFVLDHRKDELCMVHRDGKESKKLLSFDLQGFGFNVPTAVYYNCDLNSICLGFTDGYVGIYNLALTS